MGSVEVKGLMAVAARQYGLVNSTQCAQAGLTRFLIHHRVKSGTWLRVHRGVYALAPGRLSSEQWDMAACLAVCGVGVLSHHSAARRQRISVPNDGGVHLSVPWGGRLTAASSIKLWRVRSLDPTDIVSRDGFRMTRVARTLFELAGVLEDAELRVAVDSALRAGRRNLHWMQVVLEREGQGHSGSHRLRSLLDQYSADDEVCDSELESFAMELGMATGRTPHLHYAVRAEERFVAEVDLAWPRVRLGVELDSWRFHGDRDAFQRDRSRDRHLAMLGWQVLRYTWADIRQHPDRFIREIATLYDARFGTGSSLPATGT